MSWGEEISKRSQALADELQKDQEFTSTETALPLWVKHLMAMQMDAIFNHPSGAKYYGNQALAAGATEEQLMEAMQLLRMFAGRPALATAGAVFE